RTRPPLPRRRIPRRHRPVRRPQQNHRPHPHPTPPHPPPPPELTGTAAPPEVERPTDARSAARRRRVTAGGGPGSRPPAEDVPGGKKRWVSPVRGGPPRRSGVTGRTQIQESSRPHSHRAGRSSLSVPSTPMRRSSWSGRILSHNRPAVMATQAQQLGDCHGSLPPSVTTT